MENKQQIINYILEKISNGESKISKKASEYFHINQNTVHDYINNLIKKNIINRVKRDTYCLINSTAKYVINFPTKEEEYLYNEFIFPHISKLTSNVIKIWEFCCTEMINNAIDHSEGTKLEIEVIQNILNTTIIISDNGVGIFNKIQRFFNLNSLEDAAKELFKGKLTTSKENHSGEGIFFTSKILDKFEIYSSNLFFSHQKFENNQLKFIPKRKGTQVIMQLSNISRKNLIDIFNQFSSVDEGFNKTYIKIKNMFDSDPISRSQAKRLANGLEKFKEITLDFDGIDLIGQGFAHELFVVFQYKHPEIFIKPLNMNTNVIMMYNHVTTR